MGLTAAVVGASGYAGGELLRLLAGHPDLEVGALGAGTAAGSTVGAVHPQLTGLSDRPFVSAAAAVRAGADVVFLALPHGESAALVADIPPETVVVDLGADFRLGSAADWSHFYGGAHAGRWPYGLPELPGARAGLAGARRIANPGCYATAISLGLAPLLAAGLAVAQDIVVVAASGTSGAGRAARAHLLGSEVMGDLTPYKVGGSHQHLPEIRQALAECTGRDVTMSFTPVLAPMPRGILATCTARLADEADSAALRSAFDAAYDGEPFVRVLPDGQWPRTAATVGSNACQLQVVADVEAGRAVVVVALDNLGKGAAGQAIQNANLALGLPETAGLTSNGIAP